MSVNPVAQFMPFTFRCVQNTMLIEKVPAPISSARIPVPLAKIYFTIYNGIRYNTDVWVMQKERKPDSIRINDQFRVCFVWTDDGVDNVEITDYQLRRRYKR